MTALKESLKTKETTQKKTLLRAVPKQPEKEKKSRKAG
jgi:hypothetical protein